jgi:transposase
LVSINIFTILFNYGIIIALTNIIGIKMSFQILTDFQWQTLEPLFPAPIKRGRGKPHTAWREVMNSILYVLTTPGAKWTTLPKGDGFASKSAAHRWYKVWRETGLLEQVLAKLEGTIPSALKFPPARQRKKREELVVESA